MKRKYSGKRKRVYKKSSRKKARLSKGLRAAVKSIVKRNIETKEYAVGKYEQNLLQNNSYYLNPLFFVTQGASDEQRVGDRCNLQRIEIRGTVKNTTNTTASSVYPFWIYFWFVRVTLRAAGSVLGGMSQLTTADQSTVFDTTTTGTYYDPPQYLRLNRKNGTKLMGFKRMFFQPILLTATTGTTGGAFGVGRPFQLAINMKNVPFQFEEDNSGFQTKYNYYLICKPHNIGPITNGVDTACRIEFDYRVFFKDA